MLDFPFSAPTNTIARPNTLLAYYARRNKVVGRARRTAEDTKATLDKVNTVLGEKRRLAESTPAIVLDKLSVSIPETQPLAPMSPRPAHRRLSLTNLIPIAPRPSSTPPTRVFEISDSDNFVHSKSVVESDEEVKKKKARKMNLKLLESSSESEPEVESVSDSDSDDASGPEDYIERMWDDCKDPIICKCTAPCCVAMRNLSNKKWPDTATGRYKASEEKTLCNFRMKKLVMEECAKTAPPRARKKKVEPKKSKKKSKKSNKKSKKEVIEVSSD